MYRRQFENTTFTRWVPGIDIVKEAPAQGEAAADRRPPGGTRSRKRRDKYERFTIEVQFRGGPEANWLVTARGRSWRFPGHQCLHDVLAAVVF
jgi:hypothetical protein